MSNKFNKLLILIFSYLMVNNCTSIEEKGYSSNIISISTHEANISQIPYKLRTDISNESVKVKVRRSNLFGIGIGDGVNENFVRRIPSIGLAITFAFLDIPLFAFPEWRRFNRKIQDFVSGDKDILQTAIEKAVTEYDGHGFLLINASITESGWFVWHKEAKISGKIMIISPGK